VITAEELVAAGGPSAPVWVFLSTITVAVITLIAQQLKSRSDLKMLKAQTESVKDEAIKANQSATQAQANTVNVSNGFVSRMDRKLDEIMTSQSKTDEALRTHLEWHLHERNNR